MKSRITAAQAWELGLSHTQKVSEGGTHDAASLKKKIRLAMLRRLSQAIGEVRPFSFSDEGMDEAAWNVRHEVLELLADMMLRA